MRKFFLFLMLFMLLICGCGQKERIYTENTADKSTTAIKSTITPEAFLKLYNLKVQGDATKFKVNVPKTWDVTPGEYPIGLFWRLANEFSKDVGLDLAQLKGTTVDVWRYPLADGLLAEGHQREDKYPSNLVLLVNNEKVVGAWLAFNKFEVGPSVKKHYIKDITTLDFESWAQKQGLFSNMGNNKDIVSLNPVDVVKTYFKAINDGDKSRARMCLSPHNIFSSLTMNIKDNCLYNPKFNNSNSEVENIKKVNPVSFKIIDENNLKNIPEQKIGNKTEIVIEVLGEATYYKNFFTKPNNEHTDGKMQLFVHVKKYENGWKIENTSASF